ncbi:hypothetical protein EPVG_00386 [Emiliania huxleyi virus 201]|nr:nucleic acid independent nucleoside triphosphatase [Emiliania huxleyi virus 207]AEP16056.1 nucleic acid independent nucleoside triphosphatase [Emiliania huxleyi virus 208]AET98273.1 hypothetical protein EPVG_00386 [Emiliania huxleyi virus 201]
MQTDAAVYSPEELFALLCANEQYAISRIGGFENIDDLFDMLSNVWLDNHPDLETISYYKWLLGKVSDLHSATDSELKPAEIEQLFDITSIGIYRLFRICMTVPDENRDVYMSDTAEGLERRGRLAHILKTVQVCKNYMVAHSMMTNHINSSRYASLTKYETTVNIISDTDLKPHQQVENHILNQLDNYGYRHYKKYCYKRIVTKDNSPVFAWERKEKVTDFIPNELTMEKNYAMYKLYTHAPSYNMNAHLSRFLTEDSKQIRFLPLNPNRHIYSCTNGIYHTKHCAFYDYADEQNWPQITQQAIDRMVKYDPSAVDFVPPNGNDTCLRHYEYEFKHGDYINNCTDFMDIDPSVFKCRDFDNVLEYQKLTPDTIENIYGLIGRLFFETKQYDDMQLLLFFKGVAGSGKSSVLNLISECFDPEAIGILNSNCQDQFSLEHIADAHIVITYEAKRDFRFNQATLQQCVSGEGVTIVRKGEKSYDKKWTAPFVMAGNELPGWKDAAGSMARRLVLVPFNHRVIEQDEELGDRMSKDILEYIPKFTIMYRQMTIRSNKKGFWSVRGDGTTLCSQQLLDVRNEIISELQPLVNYMLRSGKFELSHMDNSLPAADTYITEAIFLEGYRQYCRDTGLQMGTWNADLYRTVFEDYKITRRQAVLEYDGVETNAYFLFGLRLVQA